jgi:hypothetical protein
MNNEDAPITSHHSRAEWFVGELKNRLSSKSADFVGTKSIVAWYMSFGYSMGLQRETLEAALSSSPDLQAIASSLNEDDISQGKPPPEFKEGQLVEVIVNGRNSTYRKGTIRGLGWHHQERQWLFFIEENGKKVSKRYEARDLRLAEA